MRVGQERVNILNIIVVLFFHYLIIFSNVITCFIIMLFQEIGATTQGIETALTSGYRHIQIDSRDRNELEVGHVLKRWIEAGKLSRKDLFISVKVSPNIQIYLFLWSTFCKYLTTCCHGEYVLLNYCIKYITLIMNTCYDRF